MSRKRSIQPTLDSYLRSKPKNSKMEPASTERTMQPNKPDLFLDGLKPTLVDQPSTTSKTYDLTNTDELDGSQSLFFDDEPSPCSSTDTPIQTLKKENSLGPDLSSFNRMPGCANKLDSLRPTDERTVLIRVDSIFVGAQDAAPLPYPDKFEDKWDKNYVRLPCSKDNLYPIGSGNDEKLVNRWELIQTALCQKFQSSLDIEEAILSYNGRYTSSWNFRGLHKLFTEVFSLTQCEKYFDDVFPKMAQLALQLPEICTQPIPLLKEGSNHSIVMSQKQASCLLANAFFCTYPRRNVDSRKSKKTEYFSYPRINFSNIFGGGRINMEKLKCILHYFERITDKMPTGTISFQRQCLNNFPNWSQSSVHLTKLHISKKGTIEDFGDGMLQVDFANKFIGGGVLGEGCVQEEIRFLICPEFIVSMLFTEVMSPNECLIMNGCERYSCYMGYADTFEWSAPFIEDTPRDDWGRRQIEMVAIDAKPYYRKGLQQFSPNHFTRELNKAYCGFVRVGQDPKTLSAVATGNWGCGAFGGDKEIKSLIQLMAAAETGRDVVYFTFDDERLMNELYDVHSLLTKHQVTVGQLFEKLEEYSDMVEKVATSLDETEEERISLFQFIRESFR